MVGASRRTSMSALRGDHRVTHTCARRRPWRTLWQSVTWLFLVSLASCSWSPRPIVAEPHLSASVVGQVVQAAGPYRIADAFRDYVELTCSVFEAAECWFGETYLQAPLPEDLTGQVRLGGASWRTGNPIRCGCDAAGRSTVQRPAKWT